ncbi:MAG: LolA family protein [Vicinamibacterales bacterium]
MRRSRHLAAAISAALWLIPGVLHAQTVEDVIAANLRSKGGLEKIKATQTVRMTGSVVARDMSGRDHTGTMTMVAKRPNLMRRDAEVDGQRMVNAFDGTTLWMGIGTAPPQQVPATQNAYSVQDAEFDSVFVDYKEKGHKIELIGKETLDGVPVYHLKVTKKGGPPQDYYLDVETGLEKKISVTGRGPDGSQMVNVTEFSDYRSVDGSMVPFVSKQRQNGTLIATITVDKAEFNVPVDDAFFKMPAK